ncbi:MAG: hypothetical protein NTV25_09285 [Methanothrix sp.]|nr:hypothetical protein [Methanothrix sp.]
MINKCVYLIFGIAALIGAYAYFTQAEDSGFCTDTSILTMELPSKEDGYLAKPTFTLETKLPTIPETVGIYKMVSPVVTAESTKVLAAIRIDKVLLSPVSKIVMTPSSALKVTPSSSILKSDQLTNIRDLASDSNRLKVQADPQPISTDGIVANRQLSPIVKASAPPVMLNTVQDIGSAYTLTTDTSYLAVDKVSGAESVLFDKLASLTERKAALPSEDILKQNADAFVSQTDLLPAGYQFTGMSYLMRQMLGQNGPEGATEKVMGVAKYSRTIEGIPVEGAGSTIYVMLGDEGKVLGYNKVSRDLGEKIAVSSQALLKTQAAVTQPSRTVNNQLSSSPLAKIDERSAVSLVQTNPYELLSPEEAFNLLKQRGLTTEISNVDTATVTDMHLAYYEAEGNKQQTDIEPIYVFSGVANGPGGSTEYKEIMSALKVKAGRSPFQMDSIPQNLVRDLKATISAGIGNSNAERAAVS